MNGIEAFGNFASSIALGRLSFSVLFLVLEEGYRKKIALNDYFVLDVLASTSWAVSSSVLYCIVLY